MVLDECACFDPCHWLKMPRTKSRALQTRFVPGKSLYKTKPISVDHMTCERPGGSIRASERAEEC